MVGASCDPNRSILQTEHRDTSNKKLAARSRLLRKELGGEKQTSHRSVLLNVLLARSDHWVLRRKLYSWPGPKGPGPHLICNTHKSLLPVDYRRTRLLICLSRRAPFPAVTGLCPRVALAAAPVVFPIAACRCFTKMRLTVKAPTIFARMCWAQLPDRQGTQPATTSKHFWEYEQSAGPLKAGACVGAC